MSIEAEHHKRVVQAAGRLSRRSVVTGAAGLAMLPSPALRVHAQARTPLNLTDFGAKGDGRTDCAPAFARALTAADMGGWRLHVPAGRFLISDRTLAASGAELTLPEGFALEGAGRYRATLIFSRNVSPSFYGLAISRPRVRVSDIAIETDTAGSGWTAAIAITGPAEDVHIERVAFRGVGTRTGHIGIFPIAADIDRLTVDDCSFDRLDFGFVRQTTDTSDHRNLAFLDCVAEDCTEVFEFNAPGLMFAATRRGSTVIEELTDQDGAIINPSGLRPGQLLRSAAFPRETRIVEIGRDGRVVTNRAAAITTSSESRARLSAGFSERGIVRNLRCRNIAQWAVGLAHCHSWDIEAQGENVAYELVHIEDGSSAIRVTASGVLCNTARGVVGSPTADNGMVHVSTGSRNVHVRFALADLTSNRGGSPNALCIQAGGPMGTTGLEVDPRGIQVSGRVLLRTGCSAVIAYRSDIHFNGLELVNPNPDARASPMMQLFGCRWSGTVAVHNPGKIVEAGAGSRGRFESVMTLTE